MIDIDNTLEALQQEVGGYIECVTFDEFVAICDEEGRLKGKEPCCVLYGIDFVGTVLLVGQDGADFASLSQDVIDRFLVAVM